MFKWVETFRKEKENDEMDKNERKEEKYKWLSSKEEQSKIAFLYWFCRGKDLHIANETLRKLNGSFDIYLKCIRFCYLNFIWIYFVMYLFNGTLLNMFIFVLFCFVFLFFIWCKQKENKINKTRRIYQIL